LTRPLLIATSSFVIGSLIITMVLLLAGLFWPVALILGFVWSLCLLFLAVGVSLVLWPVEVNRFQLRIRNAIGMDFVKVGRRIDRPLGLDIEEGRRSVSRQRLLGVLTIVIMLTSGVIATWALSRMFNA
jgi:hypothetical protein